MKILITLDTQTRDASLSATRLESNTSRIERIRTKIAATKARAGYKANEKMRDLVKRRLELLKVLKVRNKALVAAAKAKAKGATAKPAAKAKPASAAAPATKTKTKTVVAVKKKPGVVERITTTVKNGIKKITGSKPTTRAGKPAARLNAARDAMDKKSGTKGKSVLDKKAQAPAKATPSAADLAKIEKHKAELVKFEAKHKAYRAKEGPAHPTKYDPVDNEMRRDIDGAKLSIKAAKKAARTNAKDLQSGIKMLGNLKKSFMDRPKPKGLRSAAKPKVKRVTHTRAKELKIVDLEQKRKKARAAMAAIKGTKPADDRNRDLYKREINSYTVALKTLIANRGKA